MKTTKFLILTNRLLGEVVPLLPLLALFFRGEGLDVSTMTLVFTALTVTVFLFEVPTGVLADKVDLKTILILSRLLKILAFLTFSLSTTLLGFIFGAVLWGISSALDSGTFQGYVFQYLNNINESNLFSEWYGQAMTANIIGVLFAAGIATQVNVIGFTTLHFIGIVALILSLFFTISLPKVLKKEIFDDNTLENSNSFLRSLRSIQVSKNIVVIILIGVSAGAIKGSLDDYTSLLLVDVGWSLATVGYAVFVIYVLQAAGTFVGSLLSLKASEQWLNLFVCGLAFIFVGLFSSPLFTVVCLGIIIVIDGILWVQNDAALQNQANDSNRVTLASVKNFLTELTAFFVLALIWLTGDFVSLPNIYFFAGVFLVLIALIAKIIFGNKKL